MTEEIIINGVDVAGCYFYYKGECRCEQNCIDDDKGETIKELFYREPEHNKWECEPSKDCYYKQLKRLEQENKKLKKQIESDKGLITIGGKQQYDMTMAYDKCKTALEEIREVIYYCGYKDVVDKVLPKINEVLNLS